MLLLYCCGCVLYRHFLYDVFFVCSLVCVVCSCLYVWVVMYVLLGVDVGLMCLLLIAFCYVIVSLLSFIFWRCVLRYNLRYVGYFVILFVVPCVCVFKGCFVWFVLCLMFPCFCACCSCCFCVIVVVVYYISMLVWRVLSCVFCFVLVCLICLLGVVLYVWVWFEVVLLLLCSLCVALWCFLLKKIMVVSCVIVVVVNCMFTFLYGVILRCCFDCVVCLCMIGGWCSSCMCCVDDVVLFYVSVFAVLSCLCSLCVVGCGALNYPFLCVCFL